MSFLDDKQFPCRVYDLNNTEQLIEDTLTYDPYTYSQVNRRFNNTTDLLGDRTSLLTDDKMSRLTSSKISDNTHAIEDEVKEDRLDISAGKVIFM
jgi:hypothetical protein